MKVFIPKLSSTVVCAFFIVFLSSSLVYAQTSATCTMDYQCGTIPYGQCLGSVNDCPSTIYGIAVDSANNQVYYGAECRDASGDITNVTIKKVSGNGGLATTVFTEPIFRTAGNIVKVFTVENGVLYWDRVEREPGSALGAFNLQTKTEKTVTLNPGFFEAQLEIANGFSYTCQLNFSTNNSYSVVRFDGIVGQGSTSSTGRRIYVLGSSQCGPIRVGTGSDLYFTIITITPNPTTIATYTTTFYKGTTSGSSTLPSPLFVVQGEVLDFDVDDTTGAIIYGTREGLFKRVGSTTTTLNNEPILGLRIYYNRIYYNNGVTVRSTSLDGQDTKDLVQSTTGNCVCRTGFFGNNCQSCSGQVQFNNGFPSCVSTNAAGVPVSCVYDYQCGNVPYTFCAVNFCSCRGNFTGDRCNQCSAPRSLSFINGIPYCQ